MKTKILITGATGGLAQSLVKKLAENHCDLILVSRNSEKLHAIYGDKFTHIITDCSNFQGTKKLFDEIAERDIILDSFAHCVGNIKLSPLHRTSEADFFDCISTNLFSAFFTLAAFVEHLKKSSAHGSAVFVSSAAASIGIPNHEAISSAKAGLEALIRSAAATYASLNIRINAVSPGLLDTPASSHLLSSDLLREMAAKQYPIKGIGNTEDVADLMAWLLSEKAQRVTGQVWSIDGGFSNIRPLVK
ncbi:MAG: SDR family oxidoreductase [Betaproteobacteria bacterium]|nr:SDR family oxidoreductase [Betaproteobacteria bacterium]